MSRDRKAWALSPDVVLGWLFFFLSIYPVYRTGEVTGYQEGFTHGVEAAERSITAELAECLTRHPQLASDAYLETSDQTLARQCRRLDAAMGHTLEASR